MKSYHRRSILFALALIAAALPAGALKAPKDEEAAKEASRKAGIQWVRIPGGTFTMGSEDADLKRARPAHRVTVKSFQLAKTLVTNKQYRACVEAGICTAPGPCGRSFNYRRLMYFWFTGDNLPVVCVDWNQAKAFSEWTGGRLPTEAEWEYAARSGGRDQKYPWGNEAATCERAGIEGCGFGRVPVCSKPAGNTKQGLCDMAGNVWEWVQDLYHSSYNGAPTDGSAWEVGGDGRVSRGGSMGHDAEAARSANRGGDEPGYREVCVGFRPAR